MSARADDDQLFQQAKKLPLKQLERLVRGLSQELERRQAASGQAESESGAWRQEYRRCGKPNCRCADTDYRHGPYWYRTVWVDGRAKKEYRQRSKHQA